MEMTPLSYRSIKKSFDAVSCEDLLITGIAINKVSFNPMRMTRVDPYHYFAKRGGNMSDLTPGQIVHYVVRKGNLSDEHLPAIITFLYDPHPLHTEMPNADLVVFTNSYFSGDDFKTNPVLPLTNVPYSEDNKPGTWHWIEP